MGLPLTSDDNAFYDDNFLLLNHKAVEIPLRCMQNRPKKIGGLTFSALGTGERSVNLLKPTGHVMHQQFNIQQLYVLPTLYLCVLYLPENKQRLLPLIS